MGREGGTEREREGGTERGGGTEREGEREYPPMITCTH